MTDDPIRAKACRVFAVVTRHEKMVAYCRMLLELLTEDPNDVIMARLADRKQGDLAEAAQAMEAA